MQGLQGSASGRAERSVEKLFWAISSCQLRIKAKYPGMRAGRRHSASDFPHKKSNDNDTTGEQGQRARPRSHAAV
jgi:hypothetical protein